MSNSNNKQQTDISRTVVQKSLSKNNTAKLLDDDYEKQLTFCEWSKEQIQQNRDFFNLVLFADEATFHKNGFVNRHNFHYYVTDLIALYTDYQSNKVVIKWMGWNN